MWYELLIKLIVGKFLVFIFVMIVWILFIINRLLVYICILNLICIIFLGYKLELLRELFDCSRIFECFSIVILVNFEYCIFDLEVYEYNNYFRVLYLLYFL